MRSQILQTLVATVRKTACRDGVEGDGEILHRYLENRDGAAFELLVWRHGAMVEAVCRRVLGNSPEVEDAFQATFVALLRQAAGIRRHSSLGGWLHRVALRIAQRAKHSSVRRWQREQVVAKSEVAFPLDPELGAILHEEIDRLPDCFRVPFVECQVQGQSVDETARVHGLPRGTILSRLARARERLRRQLIRRGIAPAVVGSVLAGGDEAISSSLIRSTASTIRSISEGAAAAGPITHLAQGVIREMFIGKIRMAASVAIAIGVIGMGGVWLSHSSVIAGPDEPKPGERIERGPRKATDLDRMQGAWKMMSAESGGKSEDVAGAVLKFSNSSMTVQRGAEKPEAEFTVKLNSSAKPPRIDITKGDRVMPGIYELKGDKLKLCFREKGDERPTEFASEAGSKIVLIELERETPTEPEQPRVFKSKDEEIEALRNEVKKLKAQLGSERERNIKLVKQATNAERLAMMQREEAEAARRQAEVAAERERVARDLAQAARKAAEAQRAAAEKALKDAQDAARKVRENLEKKGPSKP